MKFVLIIVRSKLLTWERNQWPLVFYAEDTSPEMVILSASNYHSMFPLTHAQEKLNKLPSQPILGFGGRYFVENEQAREEVQGVFLGYSVNEAIDKVHQLLD